MLSHSIVRHTDPILITGANGFIGAKVVERLLADGFHNLRCFVRSSRGLATLQRILSVSETAAIFQGNLLSRDDCNRAVDGVSVIYHLAAGRGEKSYANAYMNSVVTTRNLLDSARESRSLKRFVCVSSLTVYSTRRLRLGDFLDETCDVEDQPQLRGEAYCYAKVRQEQIVREYADKYGIPYVIARPGVVYGPGNRGIPGRVGISSFGLFLHLGGSNRIPLSYVENCADAIVLAGVTAGVDGEIFNIIDDNPPTSRALLRLYKKHAYHFRSIRVPRPVSYIFCYLWEQYSRWSEGQLPPVFNRRKWSAYWKGHRYSNDKIKLRLGWRQRVPFEEASTSYFDAEKTGLSPRS